MFDNHVAHHRDRASAAPLLEHYRSSWPDVSPDRPVLYVPEISERTVSDDVPKFEFTARYSRGSEFFHPHLRTNRADFKTILMVRVHHFQLNRIAVTSILCCFLTVGALGRSSFEQARETDIVVKSESLTLLLRLAFLVIGFATIGVEFK